MCTLGSFRFGSKTRTAGALPDTWAGGVRNEEGFAVGAGSAFGKPAPRRMSGTDAQPGVTTSAPPVPLKLALHWNVCPGTDAATDVTWNVFTGSNAMPYPTRTTVFCDAPGCQASPSRGPSAPQLVFF